MLAQAVFLSARPYGAFFRSSADRLAEWVKHWHSPQPLWLPKELELEWRQEGISVVSLPVCVCVCARLWVCLFYFPNTVITAPLPIRSLHQWKRHMKGCRSPLGVISSLLRGAFSYECELSLRALLFERCPPIKSCSNACRTLCPWKHGAYVVHASILTRGPFVLGVDTSVNAETVNHWARVTAVTLPIHAIREIAEHTVRMYNPHIQKKKKPNYVVVFFFFLATFRTVV